MKQTDATWSRPQAVRLALIAASMQAAVWAVLVGVVGFGGLGYGFFELADSRYYYDAAMRIGQGLLPYRDFLWEYPPLSALLIALPTAIGGVDAYLVRFGAFMLAVSLGTASVTSLAAYAQDVSDRRRPIYVGAVFALCVLASGTIASHRFDMAVALALAGCMLCAALSKWEAAAAILGIGFALKITPIFVLPLILILMPRNRVVRGILWFAAAAVVPFAVAAMTGAGAWRGIAAMLQYHADRPLEIESVLGSPLLVAGLLGAIPISISKGFGSQNIDAPGAVAIAQASTLLVAAGLLLVCWLVWRRRDELLADPRLLPLAVLAATLVSIAFSKVCSPQYFLWTLPALAIVAVDRRWLGGIVIAAIVLTHVVFPANYWEFVNGSPVFVWTLVARNALLAVAAALSVFELWRIPALAPAKANTAKKPASKPRRR